jgi:hypothetical protein
MHLPYGVEDDYSISREQHCHYNSDDCEEEIGSSPIASTQLPREEAVEDITCTDSPGSPSHLRCVLQDLPDFPTQPQGRP